MHNVVKIKADGKTVAEIMAKINAEFANKNCLKENQADGSTIYTSTTDTVDDDTLFEVIAVRLGMDEEFVPYCSKWIWSEYEDDDITLYEEEDVLEQVKDMKFGVADD